MKIFFLLKEGFLGFSRARLATTIGIITISLSLALIGIFGLLVQNLSDTFLRIYNQIHLEVFIDPSLDDSAIRNLQYKIQSLNEVESLTYISPETALAEFQKDFGEDLTKVLDSNPLPPSFRVVLKSGYAQFETTEAVVRQIESFKSVDEVVFQKNIIRLMDKYFWVSVIVAGALGIAIFVISTLLIFNTIRLTIYSRQTVIEIMKLVGATPAFIKAPFIIEGILQGLIGSLLAVGLLWLMADVIKTLFMPGLFIPLFFLGIIVLIGMLLGFIGSYISVGKYLKF
jgi:cell division transport system permease protein